MSKDIGEILLWHREEDDASPDPRATASEPTVVVWTTSDQITCEKWAILPRTHGSALFTRGQTQALGGGDTRHLA